MATHWNDAVRQSREAIRLAEHASELSLQPNVQILDTLAAAYAAAGQFGKAIETAQRAEQLALQAGATEFARVIHKRLVLYGEGQVYREAAGIQQDSNGTSERRTEGASTNGLGKKH
jgi:spermidine synthase